MCIPLKGVSSMTKIERIESADACEAFTDVLELHELLHDERKGGVRRALAVFRSKHFSWSLINW